MILYETIFFLTHIGEAVNRDRLTARTCEIAAFTTIRVQRVPCESEKYDVYVLCTKFAVTRF